MDLYNSWKRDIETYRAIADDMEQALDFSKEEITKKDLLDVFMTVRKYNNRKTTFQQLVADLDYSEAELKSIVERLKKLGNLFERDGQLEAL